MRRLFLTLGLLLLLAGCAPKEAPVMAPSPSPSFAPAVAETPAVTSTPYTINPVSGFYTAYRADTEKPLSAFRSALASAGSADAMRSLMELCAHEAQVGKAQVSIGRLTSSGDYYSDTLIGAASGSGTLTPSKDGLAYTFSFTYNGGDYLSGALGSDGLLSFSLCPTSTEEAVTEDKDPDSGDVVQIVNTTTIFGDVNTRCMLGKGEAGWSSCVISGGAATILEIDGDGVRFLRAALPEGTGIEQAEIALLLPSAAGYALRDSVLTYSRQNHS